MLRRFLIAVLAVAAPLLGISSAHGQVTYLGADAAGANNSVTVTLSTIPAAGDMLLAHVGTNATDRTISASGGGWATLRTDRAPTGCTAGKTCTVLSVVMYKFQQAGDPTSYTFSVSGGGARKVTAGITVFGGVDATSPFLAHGATTSAAASATVNAPGLGVTASAGGMLVGLFYVAGEASYTALPAAYSSRYTVSFGGGGAGHPALAAVTRGTLVAAEMPAALTASASTAAYANVGIHLSLRIGGFTHYQISAPNGNTFATCDDVTVRITGHTGADTATVPPVGTVLSLGTSSGSGTWQAFSAAAGDLGVAANFTPSGANNGQATYAWSGAESTLQVRLRPGAIGSFHVNVSDGSRSEDAAEDPSFTVNDSVARITSDGSSSASVNTQIAAKPSNTGWNAQGLYVQVIRSSGATTCTAAYQNQSVAVEFALVCQNPAGCSAAAGTEFAIQDSGGGFVAVAKNNGPGAPAVYTPVTLAFDNTANALAPLVFLYGDAGQAQLHMRVPLPAPPANRTALGTSNSFVSRPFGFAFRGASAAVPVQHATTSAAAVLAAAGQNFTMTLAAYRWASGQDVNADGVPDAGVDLTANGLTPSFAADVALTPQANLPGASLGALWRGANCGNAGALAAADWSGGAAVVGDWCYSEAGNVLLGATSSDYLGALDADVTGNSGLDGTGAAGGHVGRFRPHHFFVAAAPAATLTNRAAAGCAPASAFSYMNEGIALAFTLQARNGFPAPAVTQNYSSASGYAKLDPATIAQLGFGAAGVSPGGASANLSSRLDLSLGSAGTFVAGEAAVTATVPVARAAPDDPDGPYTSVRIGIAPADADGVAPRAADMNVDVDAAGGNDHVQIGAPTELRYGRLRLQNALGSEKLALPVPIEAQYWNGAGFARNTLDSCTSLPRSALVLGGYTGGLDPLGGNCKTFVEQDPVGFAAGLGTLSLAAPAGAVGGSVLVTPNLASVAAGSYCDNAASGEDAATAAARSYLLGRWSDAADPDGNANTAYDDNPASRAAFGLYGSQPSNFIYFRENF